MKKEYFTGNCFFYLLFCASLALTWYFHKDATTFSDRTELWSDRAGYYIYLPATFFYHWDARKMPPDLDIRTGAGFSLDTARNKIDTKYTYGVALLASPFFLASGLVSVIAGYDTENGFSMIYMRMLSLAAVVYLILGLWFLKQFLDHYVRPLVSLFTITMVFLGTNLFYYTLIDGMMSHVYSFFLFAFFLFALKKYLAQGQNGFFLLLCAILALAVLVRPTNILFGLVFFFWDAGCYHEWMRRIKVLLKPKNLITLLAVFFLVFLPQLVYWKYLSGNLLHFSYGDEGFQHWRDPRIAEVLFSPLNGLFAYTPLALVFVAGIIAMVIRKRQNGWLIAVIFMVVTLISASWKMWYFGCSFGQRSYIEYFTILSVPFAFLADRIVDKRKFWLTMIFFFITFFFTYFNLRYTIGLYRFERCYFGSTWDWDHYLRTVEKASILSPVRPVQSYANDFENLALLPGDVLPSKIFTRSGDYSIPRRGTREITPVYTFRLDEIPYPWPKTMEVEVWAYCPGKLPVKASLDYTLQRRGEVIFHDTQSLDSLLKDRAAWNRIRKSFIIPDVYDSNLRVDIIIRNPVHRALFIDDFKVNFRYTWN